jgi:hypothetical protein
MQIHAVLLAAVLFVSGCVRSVHPYPSEWRSLPRATDCSAILGTYKNLGEGDQGGRGEPLFTLLVAVADHEKPRRSGDRTPGIVTISMPESGVLEARSRSLSQRFLARNREFDCSDGGLQFARTGGTSSNVGTWFGSSVVRVAKDEDGRLVVSREERGFALLGYAIPVYMAFLNWTRFEPATEAEAQEVYSEPKIEQDIVEVLGLTPPKVAGTHKDFTEFEMTATVRYALRSTDHANLQVSAVLYQSVGCVRGAPSHAYAAVSLPLTRGDGTLLVPVKWRVRPNPSGFHGPQQRYVTAQSALWSSNPPDHRPRLIRSFWQPRDYCYALPASDSDQPVP